MSVTYDTFKFIPYYQKVDKERCRAFRRRKHPVRLFSPQSWQVELEPFGQQCCIRKGSFHAKSPKINRTKEINFVILGSFDTFWLVTITLQRNFSRNQWFARGSARKFLVFQNCAFLYIALFKILQEGECLSGAFNDQDFLK